MMRDSESLLQAPGEGSSLDDVVARDAPSDDEEEECRVCRSEAEDERPLRKPCKCTGSIAFVHQDCLQSWLEVRRSDGRCELCGTSFRFTPKYDPNAPETLTSRQITLALFHKTAYQWTPFALRILFAVVVWIIVAPLLSSYAFLAWIRRPSIVPTRFHWGLLSGDIVAGLVIMGSVILSFLSIMSFADFLRVEWGNPRQPQPQQPFPAEPQRPPPGPNDIDHYLFDHVVRQPQETDDSEQDLHAETDESDMLLWDDMHYDQDDDDNVHELEHLHRQQVRRENGPDRRQEENPPLPQAPLDGFDFDQEEPVDMNLALDELLGFRGPPTHALRNLLWFVAFNTVYLGFFVFIPRILGSIVLGILGATPLHNHASDNNHTQPATNETIINNSTALIDIFRSIDTKSEALSTTFRLADVVVVLTGYAVVAISILFVYLVWNGLKQSSLLRERHHDHRRGLRDHIAEVNRLLNMAEGEDLQANGRLADEVAAIRAFGDVAMEGLLAIVKVGVLLFLKMFLLPMVLGVSIHMITSSIVGSNLEGMVTFATDDIFSCMLLHWVIGISFMLIVTVSVLQLREVFHPDILSQKIRPQEPQPDLLGNLMNETIITHIKRLILSLGIYAVLLSLHVYLPLKLISITCLTTYFPMLKLKFYYMMMPQLQIPLELLAFHLCMLTVLERNKNSIGGMQYSFYKSMSGYLGVTDCLLPRAISGFRLVGSIKCLDGHEFDPRVIELAEKGGKEQVATLVDLLETPTCAVGSTEVLSGIVSRRTGKLVLPTQHDFIAVAKMCPGPSNLQPKSHTRVLLPTTIGCYRLQHKVSTDIDSSCIEIFEEVPGDLIPRPPEGWDDLGAGGADVQGRWAYQQERKSRIEEKLAQRALFFPRHRTGGQTLKGFVKIWTILVLSWLTTSVVFFSGLLVPLAIGRCIYTLLLLPANYMHDPLCFALGSLFFLPLVSSATSLLEVLQPRSIMGWCRRFRLPPFRKGMVLFQSAFLVFGFLPVLLGILYQLAFVLTVPRFQPDELFRFVTGNIQAHWATGILFVLLGSRLFVVAVFTKRFWTPLGGRRGGFDHADVPNPENEGQNANAELNAMRNEDGTLRYNWQGRYGRVACYYRCWRAILLDFEYDKVDAHVLISNSAIPAIYSVMRTLFGALVMYVVGYSIRFFPFHVEKSEVYLASWQAVSCRLGILSVMLERIQATYHDQILSWWDAAHKVAFDDLFLVGEELLDYDGRS